MNKTIALDFEGTLIPNAHSQFSLHGVRSFWTFISSNSTAWSFFDLR